MFVVDEQGKLVGQGTRWVIGDSQEMPGLTPGATNVFHIVIETTKPSASVNLKANVSFSRVVLKGSKPADVSKDVIVTASLK